jgi:transcriptional regulator with XRE-family HTH domain
MPSTARPSTSFGRELRYWRKLRGLSQLHLAVAAGTTPRHLSFLETGRSRPGRALVLRLAVSLDVPVRDTNTLLTAAGLPPEFPERALDETAMQPVTVSIRALLDRHDPYPGCAYDVLGTIHLANEGFRRFFPQAAERAPADLVEHFFSAPGRRWIENWAEVAWAYADRLRLESERTRSPELAARVARFHAELRDVPRPASAGDDQAVIGPRFRVGERTVSTFSALLRFDTAREVTLSELRVELTFPADEASAAYFRQLAAKA